MACVTNRATGICLLQVRTTVVAAQLPYFMLPELVPSALLAIGRFMLTIGNHAVSSCLGLHLLALGAEVSVH